MCTSIFQTCRGRDPTVRLFACHCLTAAVKHCFTATALFVRRGVGQAVALGVLFWQINPTAAQNLRQLPSAEEVISQSRELSEKALKAPPQERVQFLPLSKALIGEWVRLQPDDPRVLLVRAQAAIASSLEAELARQDAELATGDDANRWDAAREAARNAVAEWKTLAAEVKTELLRRPRGGRREPNALSPHELAALENNCRLQLATALANQAICFPALSADRINSLTQSVEIVAALARAPADDPAVWPARIQELTNRRLLGDLPAAEKALQSLANEQAPVEVQPQLQAEQMRLLLETARLEDAASLAAKRSAEKASSGDVELARLEVFIAQWQKSNERNDERETAHLRTAAVEHVRQMRKSHAGYWARSAEQLLVAAIPGIEQALGIEMLERSAQEHVDRGDWRQALATYDLVAAEAEKARSHDRSFGLLLAAAKLAADRQEFVEASGRYQKLALRDSKHPRAADAHLMAIHYAGLAAKAQQPPRFGDYRALLEEHLRQWPSGKSAAQSNWRMGQLCAIQGEWNQAIKALGSLPKDDAHRKEALALIDQCRTNQITQLEALGKRDEALAIIEPLARERPDDGPLQEQFARLLADTTSKSALKRASEQWVDVRERSKPGSPRWFRAVYGLAKVQYDLGQKSQASSLIKVAALSYPELGGEEMRATFQSLLKACEPSKRKDGGAKGRKGESN